MGRAEAPDKKSTIRNVTVNFMEENSSVPQAAPAAVKTKKKPVAAPKCEAICGCPEALAEINAHLTKIEGCLRFCLKTLDNIAGEQANRSYSGSHWLAVTRHGIQLMEKEMGFGDGPKTDKPA